MLSLTSLEEAFEDHHDDCLENGKDPIYALSVNCVPGMTLPQLAMHAKRPNSKIRPSSVGSIRQAGFDLSRTPEEWEVDGHCDLFLLRDRREMPTVKDIAALQAAFAEPVINYGKTEARRESRQ